MKKRTVAVLSSIIGIAAGAGIGVGTIGKSAFRKFEKESEMAQKHLALYLLMNQWVKVKQENKSLEEYFKKNGYKKIAIYGMNYIGETLLNELSESDIEVKYGIDKNADSIYSDIEIVLPESELSKVDAIIVTPITFFDEIEELLSNKIECPVISLEDILYEI